MLLAESTILGSVGPSGDPPGASSQWGEAYLFRDGLRWTRSQMKPMPPNTAKIRFRVCVRDRPDREAYGGGFEVLRGGMQSAL